MKVVLQRVSHAKVGVNNKTIGEINQGLLLLVGIEEKDQGKESQIVEKILNLRIFSDQNDKMNLSILEIKGEILVVPQFTLLADLSSGNRPYFGNAANPEISQPVFNLLIKEFQKSGLKIETGAFGAKMEVELVNNGPVTIIIE